MFTPVRKQSNYNSCDEHLGYVRQSHAALIELLNEAVEQRKTVEANCNSLLNELESRENQLQEMKNTLLSRVSEAEDRMSKLVQLRNDETAKASRATARLRESITKLQQRFEDEKRQLRQTLKSLEANSAEQIAQLQECLKQSESDRDALRLKWHKSEANNQKLSEELVQLKSELKQTTVRLSQISQSHSELSSSLTKVKLAYQKASSRAETTAKQLGELRKQSEQMSSSQAETERSMRVAQERRVAAESALNAVRQRADNLTSRIQQLERELATEKARSDEKIQQNDTEMSKLRRRFLAVQSEAAKWKRTWQTEREERNAQIDQSNRVFSSMLEERSQLESLLKESKERELVKIREIEELQRRANLEATNASSRLLVALSTSEEGVSAALDLKRFIEEKLNPELEATKKRCGQAETEAEKWQRKYETLHTEMERCQTSVKELEQRMLEKQTTMENETTELRQKLATVEEEARLKSVILSKAEKQAMQYEVDLAQLRETHQKLRESNEGELNKLLRESVDLRAAYESTSERLRLSQRLISKLKSARDTALSGLARAQVELQETQANQEEANRRREAEVKSMNEALLAAQTKLQTLDSELRQAREEASQQLLRTNDAHERAIERMNQHLHQEAQKSQNMEQLQMWIGELRKQIVESEQARDAAQDRVQQCERTIQQLQDSLGERNRHLEQLQSQLAERSRLVESRAQELDSLKQALEERLVVVRKEADKARAERSEVVMEKQSVERQLREAEQRLVEYEKERNQLLQRITEMDKEERANDVKSQNETFDQIRDELNTQLKEMQSQRDRTAECLREANAFLVEQTANKQMLLDQLKTSQDQHTQVTSKLRADLERCQREKTILQRQVDDMTGRLARTEMMVREADSRRAKAEQEHRRTSREVEKLALESASKRAVTQATSNLFNNDLPKPISRINRSVQASKSLSLDPLSEGYASTNLVGVCRESDRTSPAPCSSSWSGSTAELEWMLSPREGSDRRKVTFQTSPLLRTAANTRPTVSEPSSAAAELEALIREVTMNLDREVNLTQL
ncbi:hypothetical protein D915_004903 [Fasciola hepatica]|uniref:Uncharacterized protein n=1 Tax=Fasciola hepatica TaxID=6192 RepID=A0A4E0R9M3_FASHE|nr:hypothetical protein D915_004903 [Fasciola hepatica]